MECLPTEIVQRVFSLVPLEAIVPLMQATKLTRSCALTTLGSLERVDSNVNEIPLEARVAITVHCNSLVTINGLIVKSVDLTKGFSVSMTLHLISRNTKLQYLVLYDSIPSVSYSDVLLATLKNSVAALKSFYSEADHPDMELVKNFLRSSTSSLEEIAFPNSPVNSLLTGSGEESYDEYPWSFGPSVNGLCHQSGVRNVPVQMWRKSSVVESRVSSGTLTTSAPYTVIDAQKPSNASPANISLRASSMTLRGSSAPTPFQFSSISSPSCLRLGDTGRRSPLAQSSGPRSLGTSSDFAGQNLGNFQAFHDTLFMSRSTGALREGVTTA